MTVLLALDLDGTLMPGEGSLTISRRTRNAITAAIDVGIQVVLATGRCYQSAKGFARDLGIVNPIVCYGGALVRNPWTGMTLAHRPVPLAEVHDIVDEAERAGAHLNVYFEDGILIRRETPEARFYAQRNPGVPMIAVEHLHAHIDAQPIGPSKVLMVGDPERLGAIGPRLKAKYAGRVDLVSSHSKCLDFVAAGTTKVTGIAILRRVLGLESASTVAIGDNHNDLEMIAWADVGVAMAAAPAEVKAIAQRIAGDVSADGAAVVIEDLVFGKRRARRRRDRPTAWEAA